jgi:hypothetical protein
LEVEALASKETVTVRVYREDHAILRKKKGELLSKGEDDLGFPDLIRKALIAARWATANKAKAKTKSKKKKG